jgi:hypothetical protein
MSISAVVILKQTNFDSLISAGIMFLVGNSILLLNLRNEENKLAGDLAGVISSQQILIHIN